ncbi:MAG: SPOR domain-containing protein [Pseudomonadota bacterium]
MSATTANVNAFDDEEEGLSGFTILAILATVIVVFILVVMYAYRQGVASGSTLQSEELPVVAADPRPVAEDVPATFGESGARQEVYDRVSGAVPSRIVTSEDPARDPLNGYSGAPQARQEPVVAQQERTTQPDPVTSALNQVAAERQSAAATPPARTVPSPSRKPVTTAPARTAPAVAAAAATHVVQVGAFDSNKAALDYFDGLSGRMGTLLSGKRPDIQQATVNGRQYHRLRIGPFTSKEAASTYCSQLKAQGQDCLVRGV